MRRVFWLFICLKLLLLVAGLNAIHCVKPNPPTTPSANEPTITTTKEPDYSTDWPTSPIIFTTNEEPPTSELLTNSTNTLPNEEPTIAIQSSSPELPQSSTSILPTKLPQASTTGLFTELETTINPEPITTTTEVYINPNIMCKNHPGVEYLPHPYDCHQFIQCDGTLGYIKSCTGNLYWDSKVNTCDAVCA